MMRKKKKIKRKNNIKMKRKSIILGAKMINSNNIKCIQLKGNIKGQRK